ncbi:MAG: DUF2723 domain-containing protein [Myxococcota bacterium]|nr:DUF2723 domain-containing protein [Myxococcota bacterium]
MDVSSRANETQQARSGPSSSVLLGLGVTLTLCLFASSDVGWYDSGELGAAFGGLGVGHPTGFPLFSALGYVFSLLPVGSLAFRLALLSAVSVGLATGCCHGIARAAGCRSVPAAVAALIFPAVFVVWLHGTRVEVYGPNVAVLALLAWTLVRERPLWRSAGVISGLGLGAHATFPLTAVGLWLLVVTRDRCPRRLIGAAPWVVLGAMIILYLPVAAGRGPWLNWGDPSDLSSLWRHLTAAGIRESFADEMGAGGVAALRSAGAWSDLVTGGVGPWLLGAVVVGLALRVERWTMAPALWFILADAIFSIWLNPMGQADLQTGVPGAWGLSLALAFIAGGPGGPRWLYRTAPVALLALLLWTGAQRWQERSPDSLAGAWGRLALAESPPGALVLSSTDHLSSLSLYLQGMEGLRPDLLVLVKQHLPDTQGVAHRYGWHHREPPQTYARLPHHRQLDRLDALVRAELPERPVMWELGDGRFDGRVARLIRPRGQLYQVQMRPGAPWAWSEAESQQQSLEEMARWSVPGFRSRRVFSELNRLRSNWHMLRDELDPAVAAGERGMTWDSTSPRALVTLAAGRHRQGDADEAKRLLRQALELDPTYRRASQNLELYECGSADGCPQGPGESETSP